MSQPTIEKQPGSTIKLVFTVTPEEAKPYVDEAVKELGASKPIAGFRPGKAPYQEIVKAFGEMRIWETALERIVRALYMRAILDNDIDTVGSPEVQVDKLTPNADIRFTIIAPIAPQVEQAADYKRERVTYEARAVKDEDVEKALRDLRMMQRKEVASSNPATNEDLAVIDLEMKRDNVVLEDGSAKDYRLYLAEQHYIPGFTDKIVGMKEGEEKTFTLPFPKEHFQKHIAGKDVDFTVRLKQVFKLELPELNDEFAKTLGMKDVQTLKDLLRRNIGLEEGERAKQKAEIELLEKLVDESRFSEIPEILVNEEVRKMLRELEQTVAERGMKVEDYLASIKKTADDLRMEFVPQAMRRIRTATLIKNVAKQEDIKIKDADVDTEIDTILKGLREDDAETRKRVTSPEYREYVAIMMRNQRALDVLKSYGIKDYPTAPPEEGHVHGPDCDHGDSD